MERIAACFGAVGIGEVATVPTAAAIANAIRDAIGITVARDSTPPHRLVALLNAGRDAAIR